MLKKTITYTNYDDKEVTEDFYFNLTKAELIEMELSEEGGLEATLNKIVEESNGKKMINLFKKIILAAYGEKSSDGKTFKKSEEISAAFSQTEAYSNLFMELVSDADIASAFIAAIIPKNLAAPAQIVPYNNGSTVVH